MSFAENLFHFLLPHGTLPSILRNCKEGASRNAFQTISNTHELPQFLNLNLTQVQGFEDYFRWLGEFESHVKFQQTTDMEPKNRQLEAEILDLDIIIFTLHVSFAGCNSFLLHSFF